jgi:predicted phage terminase large subunit-like protein
MNSIDAAMAWKARKARIDKFRAARKRTEPAHAHVEGTRESLLDFMCRVSPSLYRADHFRIYASRIECGVGGGLRLVFAAPPQHGKTQVTLHGLAWMVLQYPGKRHAYVTYSQWRARSVARAVRRILAAAGIVVSGTLDQMVLPNGGQILFTSIDGGITGEPVDGVAIIDDPFKNRKEADSQVRREVVESAYREAIETRVHPGASIFLLATRWHPKDLSGILVAEGWEYINLPAIAENDNDPNGRVAGEPLFPRMWPLDALAQKKAKVLDFTWSALYQGRPRPKGGKVFHEPRFYAALPTKAYRGSYGVDLAYTAKSSADWSICVELWREDRDGLEPVYYVVHVDRAQVEAPEFALILQRSYERRREWPMLWRASGTEKGAASFIQRNTSLRVESPPGDKLVSATDVAAAWNAGRVLVPDEEHFPGAGAWLHAFLDTLANFTGLGKEHDDDVDALGNAFEALNALDDVTTFRIKSTRGR